MTNYERICADKAFCAFVIMNEANATIDDVIKWLDTDQKTLAYEQEHEED